MELTVDVGTEPGPKKKWEGWRKLAQRQHRGTATGKGSAGKRKT